MSITAGNIITDSLILLGAIASGETPTASEQSDALNYLNGLIDSWSAENLEIPSKVQESFTLTPGQQTYTMGTGGNFNTTRAQKIENAVLEVVNGTTKFDLPIEIVNQDQWAYITVKSTPSPIPTKLYHDTGFPLDTIYLWPAPSAANTLILWSWKPLAEFANASTVVNLPPGYLRALRFNLALELSPQYGKEPMAGVAAAALESKENIKRMNQKPNYLACDNALVRRATGFNWLIGE